jgi:DNA-binding beta-propeller fold protein YncE
MKLAMSLIAIVILTATATAAIGDIKSAFPTPSIYPTGLASDGKALYLADHKSRLIYKLDPTNGKLLAEIPSPGFKPYGLAYDGRCLWVLDAEENVILQLNLATFISEKTLPNLSAASSGLAWDGRYLWLGDPRNSKILQISPEDGTTIKEIPAPSGDITGLAYDGTYLWVADRVANRLYLVWPETGEIVLTAKSPGQYPWGVACIGDKLYCADYQSDSVYTLAADDPQISVSKDVVSETMDYSHLVNNYGPGVLLNLDIYLAIPESSPHQTITQQPVFAPDKYEIIADKWGQKVAKLHRNTVKPGETVSLSYKTTVDIFDYQFIFRPEKVGQLKDIPKDIKDKYLVDDAKFALQSPVVKDAVKSAVGNETNAYWIMRKIFRYVINHIDYELSGGWNIAPAVLESGKGSCSEYSFVFIAMCRAAGLPARYSGAITQRGDLASEDDTFHRWCEIYLPNIGWIPVDPSGGDSPSPVGQANAIGRVGNRYLITTTSGGGSEYLDWDYNSRAIWQSSGPCKIYEEKLGDWSPSATPAPPTPDNQGVPQKCIVK